MIETDTVFRTSEGGKWHLGVQTGGFNGLVFTSLCTQAGSTVTEHKLLDDMKIDGDNACDVCWEKLDEVLESYGTHR